MGRGTVAGGEPAKRRDSQVRRITLIDSLPWVRGGVDSGRRRRLNHLPACMATDPVPGARRLSEELFLCVVALKAIRGFRASLGLPASWADARFGALPTAILPVSCSRWLS